MNNTIHRLTAVDLTEPQRLMKEHLDNTGEKLSLTADIVTCLAQVKKVFPEFNSFITGRRLIQLDDVVISVLIELEVSREKVPKPTES